MFSIHYSNRTKTGQFFCARNLLLNEPSKPFLTDPPSLGFSKFPFNTVVNSWWNVENFSDTAQSKAHEWKKKKIQNWSHDLVIILGITIFFCRSAIFQTIFECRSLITRFHRKKKLAVSVSARLLYIKNIQVTTKLVIEKAQTMFAITRLVRDRNYYNHVFYIWLKCDQHEQ